MKKRPRIVLRGIIRAAAAVIAPLRKVALTARRETFPFLGRRGNVHTYSAPQTVTSMQVGGDSPFIGRTDFMLRRAAD